MDVLSMTPASEDVSSWVCFDDYPSPITPAEELVSPSFFGSSLAASNALLDGSASVLCNDDADSNTVHPLDISFDWPSKANLTFPDDDLNNGFMLNDSQPFQMPKIYNDINMSSPADLLQANALSQQPMTASNFASMAAVALAQQRQQKPFLQFPGTLDLSGLTSQDLANALGLGLDLAGAMRPQKRMRMGSDISSLSDMSSVSSSTNSSELSTPMSSPSLTYSPGNPLFNGGSTVSSVAGSPRLTTVMATEVPSSTTPARPPRAPRKQSESRIPLPDLHARMGLAHDPDEARSREQHILGILQDQGFPLGERTWIRDTEEKERRRIIEEIYRQTRDLYGYERSLLEVIVRRGAYYLMQGRLRRLRRSKAHQQHLAGSNATATTATATSEHEDDVAEEEEQSSRDSSVDVENKEESE
ncbi:hypothetical protein V1517DRAFT_316209 [Lipomyces orientalis]|uniref:Uncharacterized protein n=1 Tax=Lipomyces orientalis TaxID=1233043 RepID=A0ACC3TUW6_9ASCO